MESRFCRVGLQTVQHRPKDPPSKIRGWGTQVPSRTTCRRGAEDVAHISWDNGKSDALVTYNIDDFSAAAERFGVPVLTPGQFLKRMKP